MRHCGKIRSAAGVGVFMLGLLISLPAFSLAQPRTARDYFAAGTAAARQGDDPTALQQFNKALAAGMQTAVLYYNIGVTCYRLGYLNQAAYAFKRAARSPKMAGLAYYNLGLITRSQDRPSQAIAFFQQAERAAKTENLKKLSQLALESMAPETTVRQSPAGGTEAPGSKSERGLLWMQFSAGYDDNVLLIQSEESGVSGEDDTLAGTMLFGHYYATGNRRHGLRLYGLILLDRHSNLDNFDSDIRGGGADYSVTTSRWRHNLDLMLLQTGLGGDKLENTTRLTFSNVTALTNTLQLKLQLGYESIDASPAYTFLEGNRQIGKIGLSGENESWALEYNLEYDDREDYLTQDGEFQSFSPQQQALVFTKRVGFGGTWTLELEGAYLQNRYRDENILTDGTRLTRKDNRPSLTVGLYKTWLNDWRVGGELNYVENESNLDENDYTRHAFTLTLDKTLRF